MNPALETSATILGGLAIFLYGMKLMSDGLKETAGGRLKKALGWMTRNRFAAIFTGLYVTALIQSSSATSVMAVGFVNAGLLTLRQAIGVVFGANVGTTVTGQLVSLRIADFALPAVALGVLGTMVARKKPARGVARAVLGFGFLFFGMELMGGELKALAQMPGFADCFAFFDCSPSAAGFPPAARVAGAVAAGTLCTMAVQSSSATIGIAIALAEAGAIDIWTAVPVVLGDNIGTTVTAGLAAIGANANAKRTALAHALFNLLGTAALLASFAVVFPNAEGVRAPAFFHLVDACAAGDVFSGANAGRHVAMAHTLFNIANVFLLAGFIPALARLCERLIPDDREPRRPFLERHLLAEPSLALQVAVNALSGMTRRAWTVASVAVNGGLGVRAADADAVEAADRELDGMRGRLKEYLVEISQLDLSPREARMIPELLHGADDAERIGDLAVKALAAGSAEGAAAPPAREAREAAARAVGRLRRFARDAAAAVKGGPPAGFDPKEEEASIRRDVRAAAAGFWGGARGAASLGALSVFACLEDIARHLGNIAVRAAAFHDGESRA